VTIVLPKAPVRGTSHVTIARLVKTTTSGNRSTDAMFSAS
jgi:hypothetical protein